MKNLAKMIFSGIVFSALLVLAPVLNAADMKPMHDMHKMAMPGKLVAVDPWVPTAPPMAKTLVAYMELANHTKEKRSVIGISSPQFADTQIHLSKISDGIATMQPVAQVDVPAGQKVQFKPKGLHIMLLKPKAKISKGDKIDIMLSLDDGSSLHVKAVVRSRSASKSAPDKMQHDMHQHKHGT